MSEYLHEIPRILSFKSRDSPPCYCTWKDSIKPSLLFSVSLMCSLLPEDLHCGRVVRWCWVNFQCRSVLLICIIVWQGPTVLAVGADRGCLDIFSLVYYSSLLSPTLCQTARYRLKYCLKGPLCPKQPTNQTSSFRTYCITGLREDLVPKSTILCGVLYFVLFCMILRLRNIIERMDGSTAALKLQGEDSRDLFWLFVPVFGQNG